MDAHATGVAARVDHCTLDRDAGRAKLRTIRGPSPGLLTTVAALLAAICIGSCVWFDSVSARQSAFAKDIGSLDLAASLAAHEAHRIIGEDAPAALHLDSLTGVLPAIALADGRVLYLSDAHGTIVGSSRHEPGNPRNLSELFGSAPPRRADGDGRVVEAELADGTPVMAAIRELGHGHLTIVQLRSAWGAAGLSGRTSEILASFVVLGLFGFAAACHRYRRHAGLARLASARFRERLDTSLAHGRCGVWDYCPASGQIGWSRSMYELLGYEPREEPLRAAEVGAILHPDHRGFLTLLDGAAACASSQIDRDVRARAASGGWIWLRIKGESVRDPVDGSLRVFGFAIDITGERGETERRASDDLRLRDAIESVSEAFVLWDAEGRLILCNSKFLKFHEIPPEHATVGTPAARVFAAGRAPVTERELSPTRASEPGTRTIERQYADGRWLHVIERRTRDGGIVSVGRDVSDAKRKEARLRERERRLQGSVRAAETEVQRYAAIAERNYEANLAKTEFLARMSHELRTPLNAIIGFSDFMLSGLLGPQASGRYAEYTRDIHASGLKLLGIIDDILQMSRIERGQLDLSPEVMQLGTAIDEALASIRPDALAKDVSVEVDLVPPAILHADESAVREMLRQLLHNAVKFSARGSMVRVRVRPADTYLNVFISDQGCGIRREILPHLGRPFEQVEAEYSRSGSGAGLGLAIARALVELHGGRLRLRSQPGAGTVAMLHLPLVQPAANDADATAAITHGPELRLVAAE